MKRMLKLPQENHEAGRKNPQAMADWMNGLRKEPPGPQDCEDEDDLDEEEAEILRAEKPAAREGSINTEEDARGPGQTGSRPDGAGNGHRHQTAFSETQPGNGRHSMPVGAASGMGSDASNGQEHRHQTGVPKRTNGAGHGRRRGNSKKSLVSRRAEVLTRNLRRRAA
jgi:hypothetical protein